MIEKIEIDKAIQEVMESLNPGGFQGVNNADYVRIYNRLYPGVGAYYAVNHKPFYLIMDEEELSNNRKRYHYDIEEFDGNKLLLNILNKYNNAIIRKVLEDTIIFTEEFMYLLGGRFICRPEIAGKIWDELQECLPEKEPERAILYYVMISGDRLSTKPIVVKEQEGMDLSLNYNDDLNNERINEILREEKSSLMIFHGEPGTGKTSYIRKLIADNKDLQFYWLDSKLLQLSSNKMFVEFLLDHRNAVYVLEDCEDLLRDRGNFGSEFLSVVLNMADGMLGDSLDVKFICTFNADLDKIDEAVLRKGRLSLQHEFKRLTVEKVKALSESLGIEIPEIKEMPLCDIYNYAQENGAKKKSDRKRVGFS